jgi:SAM-dependent methyltransferase
VSVQLLNDCRRRVEALSSAVPHYFIQVTADNLSPLADECADAVTARSVLIYLNAHDHVLTESYRVLRPGGRLALFEPLNAFWGEPRIGEFYGYDVASVAALAGRVRATWRSPIQRLFEVDPRSLGRAAQQAGFDDVMFTIEASLSAEPTFPRDWSRALAYVPNPLATSLGEAVQAALSAEEAIRFSAALRPQVESGRCNRRSAAVYLTATRPP